MRIGVLIILVLVNVFGFEDLTPVSKEQENKAKELKEIEETIDLDNLQKAYFKSNTSEAIIVYKYDPTKLMKIRTRIMGQSTIILPKDEVPISKKNGNAAAFKIEFTKDKNPKFNLNNTFTVTSGFIGTDTTVTIFGSSGRVYNFYLYSTGTQNKEIPNSTVYITDDGKMPKSIYLENFDKRDKKILALQQEILDYKDKLNIVEQKQTKNLKSFNIADIQLDYEFKKEIKLEAVFNDDEFTYFKFKKDFNIPKFYRLNELRDKISMNFIIFDNIIKIAKLSNKWHLELNGHYLTIDKIGSFDIDYSHKRISVDMTATTFKFESVSGNKDIAPQIVFHDKEFTYFKFDMKDEFKTFPNIYLVVDGFDKPVIDFEIIDDFIVVKELHKSFTLKVGEKHNCIRYEK